MQLNASNIATQRLFTWSGIVLLVGFLTGWGIVAGFLPPIGPQTDVEQVLRFYQTDANMIRLGLYLAMMFSLLNVTFYLVLSRQLARVEGSPSLLAHTQALLGALFTLEFIFPLMIWQAAAYRPDMDPVMTYRLHDLAWFLWLGVVSTVTLQAIIVGAVILRDRRATPIFPRWVGYTSLWCACTFLPGGIIVFFKSGPFAWNGLIAWWLLIIGFAIWMIVLVYAMLKHAIPSEDAELRGWAAGGVGLDPSVVAR